MSDPMMRLAAAARRAVASGTLGVVLLSGAWQPALAQADAGAAARIEAKSREIERYLELLRSPREQVRLAALTEMAEGRDPALVDLAVETGLASADPAMRAIALRAAFRPVRALVAKLEPESGAAAGEVMKACGNAVQYRIENYSFAKGTFEAHGQDHAGVGQVNGSTVTITIDYGCSLSGTLQRDGTLVGLISAPYKKGSLPMRAALR